MRRIVLLVFASLLLAACAGDAPAPAASATAPAVTDAAPLNPDGGVAPAEPSGDPVALLARANAALGADRVFAPAGDNAVELYLQVISATERGGGTAGEARRGPRLADVVNDGDLASQARLALNDVFPYGTVWVEQALQRGDRVEAERVLGLLDRVQPGAPALLRLRQALVVAAAPPPAAPRTAPPATPPLPARPAPGAAAAPAPVASAPAPAVPPPPAAAPVSEPVAPAVADPVLASSAGAGSASGEAQTAALPAPEPINRVTPRYPQRAMRQKLEGWVAVRLLVDGDGEVIDTAVVAADPEGIFEREALAAAQRWRFSATGRESWVERRIDFRLTR